MIQERLKEIEAMSLAQGTHGCIGYGGCVMELVSYLAGEPWSDHPECACPVLTEYAIRLNDQMNDEHRQLLKPLIVSLLNTKSTEAVQIARKRLLLWRYITVTYPILLDALKAPEIASRLRALKNTTTDMVFAAQFLENNIEEIIDIYGYAYGLAAAANAAVAASATYAYVAVDANAYDHVSTLDADAYDYDCDFKAGLDATPIKRKFAEVVVETLRLAIEVKETSE